MDISNSVGKSTKHHLSVIEYRRVSLIGSFSDGEAIRIFSTTRLVDAYSIPEKLEKVTNVYTVNAVEISLDPKMVKNHERNTYLKIPIKQVTY